MKRLIATFSLLLTMIAGASAQNDAMYVYRNDGVINAFLKADIDSICYSHLDLDSMFHKEYMVQEVWTVDSIYRIPLEVIDSVSFVTPPTSFKHGVVDLADNLLDYIIGAEDLTLKLKTNTPTMFIPREKDKIVLLEGCDVLPNGFAGKVVSVDTTSESINIVCEQTYIEDVFESFCSVQTICGYADKDEEPFQSHSNRKNAVYDPTDRTFHLGPYTATASGDISMKIIPDGDLVLKGGASVSVTVEPTFRIHTFLIVGEGQGMYFNCSITGNLVVSSKESLYGGLEWEHEFLNPVAYIPIPYTANLVNYYFNPGLFVRANATITSTASTTRNYSFGMAFDYSSQGERVVKPSLGGRLVSSSNDMTGSIDGSIAYGVYLETGFSLLSRELAKVCVRGEYGTQFNGNFVLRNSDVDNSESETVLYERLKASSIESGPFISASLQASVLNAGAGPSLQLSIADEKWDIVPTFENTKLSYSSNSRNSVDAYTELSGHCLFPVHVGYKLFDETDSEIADYDATAAYTNIASKFEHTFSALNKSEKYSVYPKVKLFGYDILASPKAELNMLHPGITSFKHTGSHYSPGEYYNDGRYYDYKYDVATTVEIESLDGVSDWGYVYRDPYGNIKHISLMQYGTSYTDTRYSYYRNEAKSTACLYGYVKYQGDTEYYYDDPQEYPLEFTNHVHSCPDDHHPHAIDLGLPSGTNWACCNVGASSPEQYGGYYAWGETSEKSYYDWDTYAYYNDSTGYVNIGSDIAGTQYDVAHVRMGGSWRMPSHEQQMELMDYCTRQWTKWNGVNGILVTGPSGGQVFLPAAGGRWNDDLVDEGSYGNVWSSSLDPGAGDNASGLYFDSGYWFWSSNSGGSGQSVRAVCP